MCLPLMTIGQEKNNGIKFEDDFSWQQILSKAKAENKYIFVDCYATWCNPCKMMDKDVYTQEEVGAAINDKFISVKVQMDSTTKDNEKVQKWYADAVSLARQYRVLAFPTYLFFSSDGMIVHRGFGVRNADDFITLANDALNSKKQYYTLIENYRQGKKEYVLMPYLAKSAKTMGDKDIANAIAQDYKKNYLDTLGEEGLCTKENLDFIGYQFPEFIYADGSKGKFFNLFYYCSDKVDKIIGHNGFSIFYINNIISAEEITNKLYQDGKLITKKPDWGKISANIRQKYNSRYAESLVSAAQMKFYESIENWPMYSRLFENKIKLNPPKARGKSLHEFGDTWGLNVAAWDVFLNCNDKKVLTKALAWSELSIKLEESPNFQYYDTKANLLYKLGRVKEAIEWEEKAIELDNTYAKKKYGKEKGVFFNVFTATVAKMKIGRPTWVVK